MLRKSQRPNALSRNTRLRVRKGCASTFVGRSLERLESRCLLSVTEVGRASMRIELGAEAPVDPNPAQADTTFPIASVEAITLSSANPVVVKGTVALGRGQSIYKIPLVANMTALKIELHSPDGVSPLNESISVLDERGRDLLAAQPSAGSSSLAINLPIQGHGLTAAGHSIYLKIVVNGQTGLTLSHGGVVGGSPFGAVSSLPAPSMDSSFVLGLTPRSNGPARPVVNSGAFTPTGTNDPSEPVRSPEPTGPTPVAASSNLRKSMENLTRNTTYSPGLVATGPLPNRGVFLPIVDQGEDSRKSVDLTNSAPVVDLALMDLPRSKFSETGESTWDDDSLTEVKGSPSSPVVTLRGPGGFPLIGTSVDLTVPAIRSSVSFAQVSAVQLVPLPSTPRPSKALEPAKRSGRSTSWLAPASISRGSLLSGTISLAFAVVSGLAFPSLVDPARDQVTARSVLRRYLLKPT